MHYIVFHIQYSYFKIFQEVIHTTKSQLDADPCLGKCAQLLRNLIFFQDLNFIRYENVDKFNDFL